MVARTGNLSMDLLGILLALLVVAAAYFKWSFKYWKRRGVFTPPPTIPLGNVTKQLSQKTSLGVEMSNLYQEFKPKGLQFCGYYIFSKPALVVFDLDIIKNMLTKDFQHFTDRGTYIDEEVDPLSGHLFNLPGLKWKNLRAKLTPTFTSGKMKMMFQTLLACSDELVDIMESSTKNHLDVDIKDMVSRFTTDVIVSCAFGIDCNSLRNSDSVFRKYGKKIFEQTPSQNIRNFFVFVFPQLLQFFKIAVTNSEVTKFFTNAVKETVDYRERNNVIRKDFMHLLIQMKNSVKIRDGGDMGGLKQSHQNLNETGNALTMSELTAQAFVFFLAGFETSSTTLTFCFYELALNPESQGKLREEIREVLSKHEGKITYASLMEMSYMDKCVNETLRKYPAVPVLNRECTKAYRVPNSDLVIEKGVQIFLPILGIQHDSEYYPDPEKFDPERFSQENKSSRHASSWLSFGEGPRNCIGLRFGLMQTKVALTVLLKNYRFGLSPKTKSPLVMEPKSFILSSVGGVLLTTEKISE